MKRFLVTLCSLLAGLPISCSSPRSDQSFVKNRIERANSPTSRGTSKERSHKSYRGKASWYSTRTNGGTRTASGEPLSDRHFTAAHRTLSFGTRVRVTNTINGHQVIVRITDRGPFTKGRIIDLSLASARRINMIDAGVVPVRVEVLGKSR